MFKNKKAQANNVFALIGVTLGIGVLAIILGVMIYVLYAVNTAMGGDVGSGANGTVVQNVSQGLMPTIHAIISVAGWLGLVVTVIVSGIVIMLVIAAFAFVRGRE